MSKSTRLPTTSIADTRGKLIGASIGVLALADDRQTIGLARHVAGIRRSHFYELKNAFEKYERYGLELALR